MAQIRTDERTGRRFRLVGYRRLSDGGHYDHDGHHVQLDGASHYDLCWRELTEVEAAEGQWEPLWVLDSTD